jgi:hypothetical protein
MTPTEIRGLVGELIDENPFAIRAVLKILSIEFTSSVQTLAVTAEERPRLLINAEFIHEHCRDPDHVKAVLCHEFLHVLLRHTSLHGPLTPARHLALDAVINSIIHRQQGPKYSSFMAVYYGSVTGIRQMLRVMTQVESQRYLAAGQGRARVPAWWHAWHGLYCGKLLADDIEAIARDLEDCEGGDLAGLTGRDPVRRGCGRLLGNHDDEAPLPQALRDALERAQSQMNGDGIWRGASVGARQYGLLVDPRHAAMAKWQANALKVLRRHLEPARGAPRTPVPVSARLPVLSSSDRRAFLRATWSPFLPEAQWTAVVQRPSGRAHVYLDVSGSMNAEMPLIVALLGRLSRWIRRPFWAFSTEVGPAVIDGGVLKAETSGGTSLACVLDHLALTRPASAVIVTDGHVEALRDRDVRAVMSTTRLHAIVTRDGNVAALRKAGVPYSQLERLP